MAVTGALVQGHLVIDVFALHEFAVFVDLYGLALRPEGQEGRNIAKVVDVVVYRRDPQGAQVRDHDGAVEGTDPDEAHGHLVKVVQ